MCIARPSLQPTCSEASPYLSNLSTALTSVRNAKDGFSDRSKAATFAFALRLSEGWPVPLRALLRPSWLG